MPCGFFAANERELEVKFMTIYQQPQAVLFTNQLKATADYYQLLLGFGVEKVRDGMLMRRENMTILYQQIKSRFDGGDLSVLLKVEDIRALHNEYINAGVPMCTRLRTRYREPLHFMITDLNCCDLIFMGSKPELRILTGGK
ncbi:MAG: hypothetical protein AAGF25_10500 [Pseudomonadota bacterium]